MRTTIIILTKKYLKILVCNRVTNLNKITETYSKGL